MNKDLFIFKSIWLVDDDPDDAAFFEDALKEIQRDALLKTIHSGAVLLESLKTLPLPDLLFLDLNIPGLDGKKCLRFIRSTLLLKQLPIVVYSSSPHPRDVMISYGLGANLYVKKPNRYGDIVCTIKQIMQLDWHQPGQVTSRFFIDNKYVPFRAQ